MADLAQVLAHQPSMRLLYGQIDAINDIYHDIAYNGGVIPSVGKLAADTYAVGDYVAFLMDDRTGALILGKRQVGTPDPVPAPAGSVLTVNHNAYGTYDAPSGIWTASTLEQSPTRYGCWFYTPADFTPVVDLVLASFEIQLDRASGGPPELFTHLNLSGVGTLDLTEERYATEQVPVGTPTFVKLPLDWGHQIVTGAIKGIGVGGGMNTGVYTGGSPNGQLRLTPL